MSSCTVLHSCHPVTYKILVIVYKFDLFIVVIYSILQYLLIMVILTLLFHRQVFSYLLGLFLILVSCFNLSKSFNYTSYLFSKIVEKTTLSRDNFFIVCGLCYTSSTISRCQWFFILITLIIGYQSDKFNSYRDVHIFLHSV